MRVTARQSIMISVTAVTRQAGASTAPPIQRLASRRKRSR
jgi:hypothetical protein